MDRVLPMFPSSIDTLVNKDIKKTILLTTDTNSRVIATPNIISVNSVHDETDFLSFNKHHLPVAVLLEGKFSSLFANRIATAYLDSVQLNTGKPYIAKGIANSKQIVIADADIITNSTSKDSRGNEIPLPMGVMPFESYQFANQNFYLNSIAYLNDPDGLLESRNKALVLRLLDKNKLEETKVGWQLGLVLGPVLFLFVFYLIWNGYRKSKFAA